MLARRWLWTWAALGILASGRAAAAPAILAFEREPNGSLKWTFSESVKGHQVDYGTTRCDSLLGEVPLATMTVYLDSPGTHASSWPAGSIPPGQWIVSRPLVDGAAAGCAASWLGPGALPDRSPCRAVPPPPRARLPRTGASTSWPPTDPAKLPPAPQPAHGLVLVQQASLILARGQGWTLWHTITGGPTGCAVVDSMLVDEWAAPDAGTGHWRILWTFQGPALSDSTWTPFVPAEVP